MYISFMYMLSSGQPSGQPFVVAPGYLKFINQKMKLWEIIAGRLSVMKNNKIQFITNYGSPVSY
jgi:hypothetical protein